MDTWLERQNEKKLYFCPRGMPKVIRGRKFQPHREIEGEKIELEMGGERYVYF